MLSVNESDLLALSSENMDCVDYAREFLGSLGSREDELRLAAIVKRARLDALEREGTNCFNPDCECEDCRRGY